MSHPLSFLLRLPGRVAGWAAVVATATLVACGGGGGSTPPPAPAPSATVSGTAASGAPLANLVVTLKDSTNHAVTATTSVSGDFTLDTSGLAPPFLLQVTTPGGAHLLSVSTDANRTATINVTPLTDVLVRSWYAVQGQSADAAFDDPSGLPAPDPDRVRSLATTLLRVLQLAVDAAGAPVADPLDLIAAPFHADGTGMDRLLDHTQVTVGPATIQLVLQAGTATQTTDLSFDTDAGAITANSSTTDGTATTTASSTDVVATQPAQQTALDGIHASLAAFADTVNTKGTSLTVADLEPFFAADLLNEGADRAHFLADTVSQFSQGATIAGSVERVLSLDAAGGRATVILLLQQTMNSATETQRSTFNFERVDGHWLFAGDGRIASVSVQAEGRSNQGLFGGDNGPAVNIDVRPPSGTVSSVSATSTFAIPAMQSGAPEVTDGGNQLDVFFTNTGPLATPLPTAGTPVTVTLQRATGGTVSYAIPLNAFTTELVPVTGVTGLSGTAATTGAHTLTWTLPTTYAVERVHLTVLTFTDDPSSNSGLQCVDDGPVLATTATSGTVSVAATCGGQPVRFANFNVAVDGVNGERSMTIYSVSVSP